MEPIGPAGELFALVADPEMLPAAKTEEEEAAEAVVSVDGLGVVAAAPVDVLAPVVEGMVFSATVAGAAFVGTGAG